MLKAVLAPANAEQNFAFAPYVYDSMYNTATALLIDKMVEIYPSNEQVLEILEPFVEVEKIPVTNGYVQMKPNFRNLLGNPSINIKPDGCDCDDPNPIDTKSEMEEAQRKAQCRTRPVTIVPQSEWDYLTTSTYNYPTLDNPIGCWIGKNRLKVCPADIGKVGVMYVRQEKTYRYGYITQPDDTYIFDVNTSVESEWLSSAFTYLFKALTSLYAIYSRDPDMRDWAMILKEKEIL